MRGIGYGITGDHPDVGHHHYNVHVTSPFQLFLHSASGK